MPDLVGWYEAVRVRGGLTALMRLESLRAEVEREPAAPPSADADTVRPALMRPKAPSWPGVRS